MRQALDKAPLCYLVSSHLWSRALSLLLSLCEETGLLKKPPFFSYPLRTKQLAFAFVTHPLHKSPR